MKSVFALLVLSVLANVRLIALNPETPAPRYEHLATVNREWARQMPVATDPGLLQAVAFSSDNERIRDHLRWVEKLLRQAPVGGLSPAQRAHRSRHLDVLHRYGQAGVFPTNHYHAHRQPYFRDNLGVLCAVGFLLRQDGQQALVERIRRENNFGYLADLASQYPEIGHWAARNGFTLDELAWIQPGYDPPRPTFETWGTGGGLSADGRINILEKNADETLLFAAGLFSAIDGVAANNIAVWDGAAWAPLGAGVIGEVHALHYFREPWSTEPGILYVGGDFSLPDNPNKRNVAEYDLATGEWRGLQTGDMQGAVYALRYFSPNTAVNSGLFVGGDFQKINGGAHPYTGICQTYNALWLFENHFKTDGPVRAIGAVDNLPMIGGEFQQVFSKTAQTWVDAPHFAYYGYPDWLIPANELPPLQTLIYHSGNVFAGYAMNCQAPPAFPDCSGLSILKAGFWVRTNQWPYAGSDSLVHGFFLAGDRTYAYGGFRSGYQSTGIGTGMIYFNGDDTPPFGVFQADSTVRAAIFFQGKIHIAGDFQHLWYEEEAFPGLARFTPNYGYSAAPEPATAARVTAYFDRLVVHGETLTGPAQLRIFDMQGRLLALQTLLPGQGETTVDAAALPAGIYVWQLKAGGRVQAGKWAVLF